MKTFSTKRILDHLRKRDMLPAFRNKIIADKEEKKPESLKISSSADKS